MASSGSSAFVLDGEEGKAQVLRRAMAHGTAQVAGHVDPGREGPDPVEDGRPAVAVTHARAWGTGRGSWGLRLEYTKLHGRFCKNETLSEGVTHKRIAG